MATTSTSRIMPTRRTVPMARIISHGRESLIWGTWTPPSIMFGTTAFAGLVLLVGWLVFQRVQARVVEYY